MLTLAVFAPRPIETATPAIVNPTGWNKADVIKHLDSISKVASDPKATNSTISIALKSKVCELPTAIYLELDSIITDFYGTPSMVIALIKMECMTQREALK